MDRIFDGLNDKQAEAVRATKGPVLVISGPGSGKTRCLTHRIAHLIASGVRPDEILSVTFTNKASGEIRERVTTLLDVKGHPSHPTVGTFHSLGLRILRKEIGALGYGENFAILDSDDQTALVKRVVVGLELDPKKFNPNLLKNKISKLKTDLVFAEDYRPHEFFAETVARVYRRYQTELQKMNALDFDDLIGLPIRIFRERPEVLAKYQNRWQYILVDEYQDTSHDQYTLITLLAALHRNLFCIGDDAQSIYMFREADIRNILNFQKDYPDGKVILLEQNYRSTQNILAAAQGVISNNKAQIPKELWTANGMGEMIAVREVINERDEARFVIDTIQDMARRQERPLRDFTVLYRTHAQSRALEEALIEENFPYQIVGGIKFYERKEIKDVLAFVRFLHNLKDAVSLERIINIPARGIGKASLERIREQEAETLLDAVAVLAREKGDHTKAGQALAQFHALLTDAHARMREQALSSTIKMIVKKVKYEDYLANLKGDAYENAEERIENVRELLTVAKKYDNLGHEAIPKFLEDVALLQGSDLVDGAADSVTLMTAHSAKGLEFPIVFIVGMEEGLFPHSRSIFEPHELEEERRLCYVALTRAKERLFLTHAKYRHIFGSTQANICSRFIGEIPAHVLDSKSLNDEDDDETVDY